MGNDNPYKRIVVSFTEINPLSHKDNKIHISDQVWFIQHGYPFDYRARNLRTLSAQNPDEVEVDVDLPTDLNEADKKVIILIWKEISKNDFLAIKNSLRERTEKRSPHPAQTQKRKSPHKIAKPSKAPSIPHPNSPQPTRGANMNSIAGMDSYKSVWR
ncbi:hypothetical protein OCU04_006321 [Sclerotinia nivalis]|uniref:Uncharacterized protein n=1 Tax=Sclerotinia nivalis TaxID=352851 RepID=A0A9X0ANM6_9HELO|nr:hypothetical protein OCU04_006321 [Sclerotinia nivalis]